MILNESDISYNVHVQRMMFNLLKSSDLIIYSYYELKHATLFYTIKWIRSCFLIIGSARN